MTNANRTTRCESDGLGERAVPADALWGIHALRARENFPPADLCVSPALLRAYAIVKKACAAANQELGYLAEETGIAIQQACDEIAGGQHTDALQLDALQGGAGTSTNMVLNEVIANRALQLLGRAPGDGTVIHPLDQVNLHQSTNDTYPTALRVAAIHGIRALSEAFAELQGAFQDRERAFADIVKIGRTELVEAVPMTLGAEFAAFAEALSRDRWRTFKCEERLRVVNLGGTAVGTGLTAPRSYIFLVIETLRAFTGLGLTRGENVPGETAHADAFVEVAGILKAASANLQKIAGDLRLLAMDGQITLPAVQAGSSIMPGKVNPVILEHAIQTGIKVDANDQIIAACAARGSLQINEFLPLLGHALLETLSLLHRAAHGLAIHVKEITADTVRCEQTLATTTAAITAFVPVIGYNRCRELLARYGASDQQDFRAFLEQELGQEPVARVLSPQNVMSLGYRDHENNT